METTLYGLLKELKQTVKFIQETTFRQLFQGNERQKEEEELHITPRYSLGFWADDYNRE